jgi:hypothetical protein
MLSITCARRAANSSGGNQDVKRGFPSWAYPNPGHNSNTKSNRKRMERPKEEGKDQGKKVGALGPRKP